MFFTYTPGEFDELIAGINCTILPSADDLGEMGTVGDILANGAEVADIGKEIPDSWFNLIALARNMVVQAGGRFGYFIYDPSAPIDKKLEGTANIFHNPDYITNLSTRLAGLYQQKGHLNVSNAGMFFTVKANPNSVGLTLWDYVQARYYEPNEAGELEISPKLESVLGIAPLNDYNRAAADSVAPERRVILAIMKELAQIRHAIVAFKRKQVNNADLTVVDVAAELSNPAESPVVAK